uniref:Voltage-dependent T-type calcium channel subunit alpha n=1 Tax=Steinernema glaseri TaxID=37863 RepID=A0A1I8A0L3_9BILA
MLQQPVAKELRSFQSLSKFAGPVQKRSTSCRRTSTFNTSGRRPSHSKRKAADSYDDSSTPLRCAVDYRPSVSHEAMQLWSDSAHGSAAEMQRQPQVEWDENPDYFEDEEEDPDIPYPGFVELSLKCLKQSKPPRSWTLRMVTNPWFDRLTMGVIMLNCITLGMYRPCEDGPHCNTYRCQVLSLIDHTIFGYFAAEMVIKVIALGFTGPSAYLSDTWNRLDFFIVIAGCAEYLLQEYLGNINLTAIRTIRVGCLTHRAGMITAKFSKSSIGHVAYAGKRVVVMLLCFLHIRHCRCPVMGWAATVVLRSIKYLNYGHSFRNRCVINMPITNLTANLTESIFADVSLTRYYIPDDTSLDYICSQSDAAGIHTCDNLPAYTMNGRICNLTIEQYDQVNNESCINWNIYYNECRVMHRNPFQGSVSFDNIGFAWVAIFLVISLEGWTDIMYYVQDAHSFWNWIYFVLLIVIGAFFMINLCLVVIATQFAETKRRETERMLQERKRMRSYGSLSGSEQGGATSSRDGGGDSVYAAFVRFVGQTSRRTQRFLRTKWREYQEQREANRAAAKDVNKVVINLEVHPTGDPRGNALALRKVRRSRRRNTQAREQGKVNGSVRRRLQSEGHDDPEYLNSISPLNDSSGEDSDLDDDDDGQWSSDSLPIARPERNDHRRVEPQIVKPQKVQKPSKFAWVRQKVRKFVTCDHFTRGILVAILVNTLSMGVEYHLQPEWLTTVLEYSNYFFTGLFAFEMILKVFADGLFGYLSDGFNLFDGGIVALSVLELFQEGKGGLSVLRTFRLLRILKLVRFMPALRYQLVVMLRTMDNVTVFFGLLVLFIFIFSILGMNLFGCKFCKIEENAMGDLVKKCERKNFDTLLWALITVFQILTQEDWNMVLFNGMAQTTPWAALYFVALMTFGNYVLFNLLVAILVEGFQESKEEEKRQLEEEARRRADEEERERKRELEILIAKTSSPSFIMKQREDHKTTCTCGPGNLSSVRAQMEGCPRSGTSFTRSPTNLISDVVDFSSEQPWSSQRSDRSEGARRPSHQFYETGRLDALRSPRSQEAGSMLAPRVHATRSKSDHGDSDSDFEEAAIREKYMNRLNRHTSLVLPTSARYSEPYSNDHSVTQRQRMNSWCGLHTFFNPHCPIHGRRALLEAYARDKFIEASQELQQVLAEEERRAEEMLNTKWRRLLRKTWVHTRSDYSLFLFSPTNRLRQRCLKLTQKKWFDYIILMFIGINCITLAMERPSIPPHSHERLFLTLSSYIFTVIFTIEMSLKVIANGCLLGPGAYFKDGWNILDGTLVIISLINVLFEFFVTGDSPKIFGVIRVLRLLRALRPLRVINRAPGVKLVVMTLISSLKPIGNIVLICCTFFIIFGILGVQLFKGMMFHCIGPEIANVTTHEECDMDKRNKWVNHRYNFDNLGQALMSLFVLSSKDGWVSIMYQGIDSVGVDMQPIENYNEWRMIYFISFLLLVGFFVLNMFVGVVVENFHKCKEALEAEMKEKARQKRLERKLRRQQYEDQCIKKKKREKPHPYWYRYGPTRLFIHNIVTSKYFDLAIALVIGINVISMAMEFYMMPAGLKYVLKALNYFFTAVFTLEAGMKLMALGIRRFLKERWNQLDIFIVFLSIAGIIFEEFEALELPINPTIIRVMRVLRIARVLKLLKMAKGIRSLLDTVGEALPQVGNLGSLFFLLFFIFAALGVELFGKLECSEEHPCDGLGEHAHFKNFGMAFLTLFRIATGDNWNGIMKDALRDDCDPADHCQFNCCVDPILAPCFFVIFVLISQFVLVNVVVAVLMKHLEESNKREEASSETNAAYTTDAEMYKTDTEVEDNADSDRRDMTLHYLEQELIDVEQKMVEEGKLDASIIEDYIHSESSHVSPHKRSLPDINVTRTGLVSPRRYLSSSSMRIARDRRSSLQRNTNRGGSINLRSTSPRSPSLTYVEDELLARSRSLLRTTMKHSSPASNKCLSIDETAPLTHSRTRLASRSSDGPYSEIIDLPNTLPEEPLEETELDK